LYFSNGTWGNQMNFKGLENSSIMSYNNLQVRYSLTIYLKS
jgi:hypothetical protein